MSATTLGGGVPGTLVEGGGAGLALSLTFDDGPDATSTPQILRELARCHTAATFFMVGERVLLEPEVARQVRREGHDVQLHCQRHIRHTELTEDELQQDSELALKALESVEDSPRLWRPPWGVCTDATHRVVAQRRLRRRDRDADRHLACLRARSCAPRERAEPSQPLRDLSAMAYAVLVAAQIRFLGSDFADAHACSEVLSSPA